MARYNSSSLTTSINGTATVASPYSGALTNFTGTAPYTVTLPSPVSFPGTSQTFYNSTAGTVTLSTPSGLFGGLGASGTGTLAMPTNTVTTVTSDGTNYIVLSEDGSALVATSGSFTGDVGMNGATVSITSGVLTLNPSTSGTMNNVAIGGTTRAAGSFVALNANGQVNFTSNTSSSSTTTGTLVVTGGMGVSGTVYSGGFNGNLTGTIQTASQTNITAIGSNNAIRIDGSGNVGINKTAPSVKLHVVANAAGVLVLDLIDTTTVSSLMDAASTNNMIYLRTAFNSNPGGLSNSGAKWGIAFTGTPAGDNVLYPVNANSSALSKTASIYAVSEDSGAGYNRQVGLSFWTSGFDLNQAERLRIRNDGFIGIATSTPASKLTVKATDGATGGIRLAHSTDNGPVVNIFQSGSDGYIDLYTGENPTTLRTHIASYGDSYFAPAANGRLGVGVTNPAARLDVRAAITSDSPIAFFVNNHGTDRRSYVYIGSNPGTDWKVGKDLTNSGTNRFFIGDSGNTERLVILETSGNVGVGTTGPTYKLDVNGSFRSAYSHRNYQISHSSTNTSGNGQTTTNITQIADMTYEYSYYIDAGTGGYPTCPYSYHVYCPVQKQSTGGWGMATVEIWGMHRGMWGTSYSEYQKWAVGSGGDGGGMILLHNQNGANNDGSQRVRMGYIDFNGTFVENGGFGTSGVAQGSYTGNTIGNSYYKMPFFFKIYTNCGADKEYMIKVTTSDPTVLGPPYKGAMRLLPNTTPTSAMYW